MTAQTADSNIRLELAELKVRVDLHEESCYAIAQRNEATLISIDNKVDRVHSRIGKIVVTGLVACVATLLGLVSYLVVNGVPWAHNTADFIK